MSLGALALWTGLLPILTVGGSYLVSIGADLIPKCVPFVTGCTSISSAGRYGLAYFTFKAGILPSAVLLAAFWIAARQWLLMLGDTDGPMVRALVFTGCTSAAFLILYGVFLGSDGEFYALMRRYGINIYFSFSYLSQLMMLGRLQKLRRAGFDTVPENMYRGIFALMVIMLVMGLGSIPISDVFTDDLRPRNIVEWNFALLMMSYYLVAWRAWRQTGFAVRFETN